MSQHIAIIGGGFSGAMVAANLLRLGGASPLRVTVLEPRPILGQGVAYSTLCSLHLLNVPAGRMSAWADRSKHFLEYAQRTLPDATASDFLQRSLYGEYIRDTFAEALAQRSPQVSFKHVRAKCVSAIPNNDANGVQLELDNGTSLRTDRVVLTAGNFPPVPPEIPNLVQSYRYLADPWRGTARIPRDEPVFLIGTGLTAVDVVLELMWRGHAAPVIAVSRHGYLPKPNLRNPTPVDLDLDFDPAQLCGNVRRAFGVARSLTQQCQWQNAIDALRPHSVNIWRSWPLDEKMRFLRHARAFWDIHRHRIPPQVAETMDARIAEGKLTVLGGRIVAAREEPDALAVRVRRRGGAERSLRVGWVVNCTGPDADISRFDDPLFRQLLHDGYVVPDPLRQGAETNDDGALVDAAGRASKWLLTIGTLCKPATWESIAVPEIAAQAQALVPTLLKTN